MSEVRAEGRRQYLQKISDNQFLFLYATRLARLASFKKLNAPKEIMSTAIILADEIVKESKNRHYSSAELYIAVTSELKKNYTKRAS